MKVVRTYALAALLALPALCLFVPASGQAPPADPQPGFVGGFGGGGFGFGGVPGQVPGSSCIGNATAGRYTVSIAYGGPVGQAKLVALADRVQPAESFVGVPSELVAEGTHALLAGAGSYRGKAVRFRCDVWQSGIAQRVRLIITNAAGKEVKRVSQALDAGTGMPVMIMPGLPPGL